jgi:hypothetical protein
MNLSNGEKRPRRYQSRSTFKRQVARAENHGLEDRSARSFKVLQSACSNIVVIYNIHIKKMASDTPAEKPYVIH